MKKEDYYFRELVEQVEFNQDSVLLHILSEETKRHPFYFNLIENIIYASAGLKLMYGQPVDAPPLPYEEFLSNLTVLSDRSNVERMRIRCIHERKTVEFIIHAVRQNDAKQIRTATICSPLVDRNNTVIGLFGTAKLIEIID